MDLSLLIPSPFMIPITSPALTPSYSSGDMAPLMVGSLPIADWCVMLGNLVWLIDWLSVSFLLFLMPD
jgi:hypothetical protein